MRTSLVTHGLSTKVLWSLLSLLDNEARPVYLTVYLDNLSDCNVCFVKAWQSNVKLFWIVSCLDTCVSAVSQVSNFFTISQTCLVSTKSDMSCSSHILIPLSWPMSLSQKKCQNSITVENCALILDLINYKNTRQQCDLSKLESAHHMITGYLHCLHITMLPSNMNQLMFKNGNSYASHMHFT